MRLNCNCLEFKVKRFEVVNIYGWCGGVYGVMVILFYLGVGGIYV